MLLSSNQNPIYLSFFGENEELVQASSTGRLDVMGGIADYSGSMVLQKPIREKTFCTIAVRQYNQLKIKSLNINSEARINLDEIPNGYQEANFYLKKKEDWLAYVVGCYLVIQKEKNIRLGGLDILIESEIPLGKGVSSSAALEISIFRAISELFKISFSGTELPRLAQKAENLVVGAPCGLMDQLACYFGEENHLLPIHCQPDKVFEPIKIPDFIKFYGIDSGIKHAVSGASYSDVRTAAFMGYSIISSKQSKNSENNGYLSNISPSDFESKYSNILYSMEGRVFLREYGETSDPLSKVKSEYFYKIKECTQHPIYENERVKTFMALLKILSFSNQYEILPLMGELMYQSHESYNKCGLGNEMTDKIVELCKQKGIKNGIYGAKITGGGSGGTVCILADNQKGNRSVMEIFEEYKSISRFHSLHLFV